MSMKNSNDTIGNRTRDLPACSASYSVLIQNSVQNILCYYKIFVFLLIVLYFSRCSMKLRQQKVKIRMSEVLEGNSSEKTSEFLPPPPFPGIPQRKRTRRNRVLKKRLSCSQVAQTKL